MDEYLVKVLQLLTLTLETFTADRQSTVSHDRYYRMSVVEEAALTHDSETTDAPEFRPGASVRCLPCADALTYVEKM